jgi:hypothetical protein
MYWKIQKVGPEQLVKTYGLHVLLLASVILNGVLWLSIPKKSMSAETKMGIDVFARNVTCHLIDSSYITCQKNLMDLRSELAPDILNRMIQGKELPANESEVQGMVRETTEHKRVCSVRIDSVKVGDPNAQSMIPVRVEGVCAIHSADETSERNFAFQYLIGTHKDTGNYIIAGWQDMTPQGQQQ